MFNTSQTMGESDNVDSSQSSSAGGDIMAHLDEHVEGLEPLELGRYWELEHDPEQIIKVGLGTMCHFRGIYCRTQGQ